MVKNYHIRKVWCKNNEVATTPITLGLPYAAQHAYNKNLLKEQQLTQIKKQKKDLKQQDVKVKRKNNLKINKENI